MDLELVPHIDAAGDIVLVMIGALDLASRERLYSTTFELLAGGPASFALDMAGIDFIDSTGIGAMIEISHRADELGIEFSIRQPSDRVVRILEITGLAEEWPAKGTPAT